jgi:hypothetical protein
MRETKNGRRSRAGVTRRIVEEVAEAEGVSPVDLSPPLYEVVDPEALDRLFGTTTAAGRTDRRVAFAYQGYDVVVSGDGHVSVEAREIERGDA